MSEKKITAVIGLGEFGWHLALCLSERGGEVIAIDENQDKINMIKNYVSKAVVADVRIQDSFLGAVPKDVDCVVVALGTIESSIIATLFLKEIEIKRVMVKAISDEHERILKLLKIDNDDIIFPEKNMAERISERLLHVNIFDYVPLTEEYSIGELAPLEEMQGKTLEELHFRTRYFLSVIAIRELIPPKMIICPAGDFTIKMSDILIVLGLRENIEKFAKGEFEMPQEEKSAL
ncbi:MAG: potassium channel family protein [bacterium]